MSNRINLISAAAVLAILIGAHELALMTSQFAFASKYPPFQATCFTRIYSTSVTYTTQARACDTGEEPGAVEIVYAG
jgi:hypothetical protein